MKNIIFNAMRILYFATPSRIVRLYYFRFFCAAVKNRKMVARVEGIRYDLDLGETIDVCLLLNRYEPDVKNAIVKYCKPGMVVFDIGANVGAHSLQLAKIVGNNGIVWAFEPTEFAYKKLTRNTALNLTLNIKTARVALSDHEKEKQQIEFRSSWPTAGARNDYPCSVNFIKLDTWCYDKGIDRVDFMKLDVDGNECPVISGAKESLSRWHPTILMEAWGPNFANPLTNPLILLEQHGYRFFHIDSDRQYQSISEIKERVSSYGKLTEKSINIIARC